MQWETPRNSHRPTRGCGRLKEAIEKGQSLPHATTKKEVFLTLKVAATITELTKRSEKDFSWGTEQEEAFNKLKALFTSAPILCHFSPERQTVVETDANDYALECILSQIIEKRLHPVAFYSQKFNEVEINYEIHDNELLAIITTFREWRYYLEGGKHQVIVYTDYKNLEYFTKPSRVLNCRQARWAEFISQFDFQIIYRPRNKGGKPDALSRHPEYRPKEGDAQLVESMFHPGQLIISSIRQIEGDPAIVSGSWTELSNYQLPSESGTWNDPKGCSNCSPEEELVMTTASLNALPVLKFNDGFLERISQAAEGDEGYQRIVVKVLGNSKGVKAYTVKEGLLYYKNKLAIPDTDAVKTQVLEAEHDSKIAGYFGMDKTLELVTRNVYWPGMADWITD